MSSTIMRRGLPPALANSAPMSLPSVGDRSEKQPDILIAVMGATGTGKSTFINRVSGSNFGVGDGLQSCTSDVAISHAFELFGRQVILIDTPGFDDSTKSDTDILKMIAAYLTVAYQDGIKLSGIIYMHRISDVRMGGASRRNFRMFRKLCGEETLKNVVIVTTRWDKDDLAICEAREKELMTDEALFKPVLDEGAKMVRHDNTVQTARAILRGLFPNRPEPLRIQRQLVDEGKDIRETDAGEELAKELAAIMKKHKEDLEAVRREMAEALAERDLKAVRELEDIRKQLANDVGRVEQDRERLSREYAEELQKTRAEIERLKSRSSKSRECGDDCVIA